MEEDRGREGGKEGGIEGGKRGRDTDKEDGKEKGGNEGVGGGQREDRGETKDAQPPTVLFMQHNIIHHNSSTYCQLTSWACTTMSPA